MALFKPILALADLPAVGTSRESGTFDFKADQDAANQRELAKDVAAFANALGGVVLVGAVEDKKRGTLGAYKPIARLEDAETLRKAYELAVTQRCVPKPVVDVVRIETLPPDRPAGHVVAVNVYASQMAPIGVRWDESGTESFAFPLRTATQAAFMTPAELPMLIVPEIRRVAILIDSIPERERFEFRIIFHGTGKVTERDVTLLGVDQMLTTVRFQWAPHQNARDIAGAIPLDRVRSVWRRDDLRWNMEIDGTLSFSANEITFRPIHTPSGPR